jgi:hypothetical protein
LSPFLRQISHPRAAAAAKRVSAAQDRLSTAPPGLKRSHRITHLSGPHEYGDR